MWRGGCLLEFEINKTAYQNGQKACLFCISLAQYKLDR